VNRTKIQKKFIKKKSKVTSVIEMALLLAPDGIANSLTVSLDDFSPDINLKK
jgi:hypothetical protein